MTLLFIVIATLVVSAVAFVGILFFGKHDHTRHAVGISLAAGALLGATFLNIFPELFEEVGHGHESFLTIEVVSYIILASVLLFFLLEKFLHWHHCHCKEGEHCHDTKPFGYINLIGDALHNFVDGALIATTFVLDPTLGFVTTVAIMFHEIPQEIADYSVLIHAGFSRKRALFWNVASALSALVGGVLTYYFTQSVTVLSPILLAIAGGSFLYLSMADIIPELHKEVRYQNSLHQLFWLLIGIGLIYFSNIILDFAPHVHA